MGRPNTCTGLVVFVALLLRLDGDFVAAYLVG
jgi:hypothetical protein